MRRTTRIIPSVLAVLAVTLTACDDSTGVASLDDTATLDAALLAADATVEDVTLFGEPFGFSTPIMPLVDRPSSRLEPAGPGAHGSFSGDFSGVRSVTFYDEEGLEQDAYDALTTESIHIEHEVEGTITRDVFTAEIYRERDLTVSGLAGEETTRTWNGTGSSSLARSGVLEDGTERSHTIEGEFTIEDVVVPIPGSDNRWPLSGTITRHMTVTWTTADGTATREVDVVITFDGTEIATAVINGETVDIDLSTVDGRNPLRRRRG